MTARREVRVTDDFFQDLDRQLSAERGPNGEPSATDFLVMDLPAVVEKFALGFEGLAEAVTGMSAARMVIGTSALLRAYVVYGVELSDGAVELVGIEIDN